MLLRSTSAPTVLFGGVVSCECAAEEKTAELTLAGASHPTTHEVCATP